MKATTTSIKEMYNEFIEKNGFAPNRLYCVVEVDNNDKYHANIAIEPYSKKHDGAGYEYIWWFADDLDELIKMIDYPKGHSFRSFRICDLIEMWSGK